MNKLPWFKPKPLKVGDRYPVQNYGWDSVGWLTVVGEEKWNFPSWVTHKVLWDDGYTDFTGGSGFVNQWGIKILRSRWELAKFQAYCIRKKAVLRMIRFLERCV